MKKLYEFLGNDIKIKDITKLVSRLTDDGFDKSLNIVRKFVNRQDLTMIEINELTDIVYSCDYDLRGKLLTFLDKNPISVDKFPQVVYKANLVYDFNMTVNNILDSIRCGDKYEKRCRTYEQSYQDIRAVIIGLVKTKKVEMLEQMIKKMQSHKYFMKAFIDVVIDLVQSIEDVNNYKIESRIITKILITRLGGNRNNEIGGMYMRVLYLFCPRNQLYMLLSLNGVEYLYNISDEDWFKKQMFKNINKKLLNGDISQQYYIKNLIEHYYDLLSLRVINIVLQHLKNGEILDLILRKNPLIKLTFDELVGINKKKLVLQLTTKEVVTNNYIINNK